MTAYSLYRVSFGGDEKVLKVDSSYGCTTCEYCKTIYYGKTIGHFWCILFGKCYGM